LGKFLPLDEKSSFLKRGTPHYIAITMPKYETENKPPSAYNPLGFSKSPIIFTQK